MHYQYDLSASVLHNKDCSRIVLKPTVYIYTRIISYSFYIDHMYTLEAIAIAIYCKQ